MKEGTHQPRSLLLAATYNRRFAKLPGCSCNCLAANCVPGDNADLDRSSVRQPVHPVDNTIHSNADTSRALSKNTELSTDSLVMLERSNLIGDKPAIDASSSHLQHHTSEQAVHCPKYHTNTSPEEIRQPPDYARILPAKLQRSSAKSMPCDSPPPLSAGNAGYLFSWT